MFKIHPKVPECMSDVAKGFIMNCFTPNPDDRATAAGLLKDIFLKSSPKKKVKAQQEAESKDFLSAGEASRLIIFYVLSDLLPVPAPVFEGSLFALEELKPQSRCCLAADYHRSLSVPISILVEDTDSYSDSIDLSCSLDLRRSQAIQRAEEISESPPTNSFLV